MNRFRISYTADKRRYSPVSMYVHRSLVSTKSAYFRHAWEIDGPFDPPLPPRVVGKGYPFYHIETDAMEWLFASLHEIEYVIAVLSRRCLPSTPQLVLEARAEQPRGKLPAKGAWTFVRRTRWTWLKRLPREVMSWKKRQRVVRTMQKALEYFRQAQAGA